MGFLRGTGRVGEVATMRAIARRPDGAAQALVELKAVDATYPHQGSLVLEDGARTVSPGLLKQTAFMAPSPRRSFSIGSAPRSATASCSGPSN